MCFANSFPVKEYALLVTADLIARCINKEFLKRRKKGKRDKDNDGWKKP